MLVSDQIRECACFAYMLRKGAMTPLGTAFFVGVPLGETGRMAPAVITAFHLVVRARTTADDGCIYLRVNRPSSGYEYVKVDPDEWAVPDQTDMAVDVAACLWPFDRERFGYLCVGLEQCFIPGQSEPVGVGTDLFFTGLFVNHAGSERNEPIVRIGNIAAMPQEPVATRMGKMEAYLVEARSVGGLSGSPAFAYFGDLAYDEQGRVVNRPGGSTLWSLLGVMHGHWAFEPEGTVEDGLPTEFVNMGIAVVTPIAKALALLVEGPLRERLQMAEEGVKKKQEKDLPVMDSPAGVTSEFERFQELTRKLVNTPKPNPDESRDEGRK